MGRKGVARDLQWRNAKGPVPARYDEVGNLSFRVEFIRGPFNN